MQLNGYASLYRSTGGLGSDKKGSSGGGYFQNGRRRNPEEDGSHAPHSNKGTSLLGATPLGSDLAFSLDPFSQFSDKPLTLHDDPQKQLVLQNSVLTETTDLDLQAYLESAYHNQSTISPELPAPTFTTGQQGLVYQAHNQQARFVFQKGDTTQTAAKAILNGYPTTQTVPLPLMERAVNHTLQETPSPESSASDATREAFGYKRIRPGTQLSVNDTLVWVGLLYKTLNFNPDLAEQVSPDPEASMYPLNGQLTLPQRVEVRPDGTLAWSGSDRPLAFQTLASPSPQSARTRWFRRVLYTMQWFIVLALTGCIALGLAVFIDPNQIQELQKGFSILASRNLDVLFGYGPQTAPSVSPGPQSLIALDPAGSPLGSQTSNLLNPVRRSLIQRTAPMLQKSFWPVSKGFIAPLADNSPKPFYSLPGRVLTSGRASALQRWPLAANALKTPATRLHIATGYPLRGYRVQACTRGNCTDITQTARLDGSGLILGSTRPVIYGNAWLDLSRLSPRQQQRVQQSTALRIILASPGNGGMLAHYNPGTHQLLPETQPGPLRIDRLDIFSKPRK